MGEDIIRKGISAMTDNLTLVMKEVYEKAAHQPRASGGHTGRSLGNIIKWQKTPQI